MAVDLRFQLRGPFRIHASDGTDITPRLAKAQGLLLLLLTGTNGARGRAWLQDMLWSDRGPDQSAASLRQTLSVVRRALGNNRDILHSDRQVIALDMPRVHVDAVGNADFAEGLDVRDAEFDTWLAAQRAQQMDPEQRPANENFATSKVFAPRDLRDRIALVCKSDRSAIADWTAQTLADSLFIGLSESAHVEVFRDEGNPSEVAQPHHIVVELNCLQSAADRMDIRVAARSGYTRRQIFSAHCCTALRGAPPIHAIEVLRLVNNTVEAITFDRVHTDGGGDADPADHLMRLAIAKIFSMRPDLISDADTMLSQAHDLRPSPNYLAWRLQIRTIQTLERHAADKQRLREEGELLATRALENGSGNSMVLALVANANLFLFKNPGASLHFARLATELNPGNPMAAWALSSARLYNGDAKRAYVDAVRGRQMTANSPRQFFWDLQLAATAMILGRLEESTTLLQGIAIHRPQFRPPLRYLIALDATRGREESARKYFRALQELEPDFSIPRLMNDPDYPASLVHRTSLIKGSDVLALGSSL